MSYKIVILKNDIQKVKNYHVAEVAYKTDDGKTKGMKVLDFVQKDIFATLQDVKAGDVLNADFEKNAKGFWQFAAISKTGETASVQSDSKAASAAVPAKSGGNWETSAERAARQVMIVRQSSLSTAVALLNAAGIKKVETDSVIEIAKDFEAYVLGTPVQTGDVE